MYVLATKRPEQCNDEDLDLIMSLLEKDYTKAEPEKAPNFPPLYDAPAPVKAEQEPTEEVIWEETPVAPVKKKSGGKAGLWVILSLEIVVLLGLVYWWVVRIL